MSKNVGNASPLYIHSMGLNILSCDEALMTGVWAGLGGGGLRAQVKM